MPHRLTAFPALPEPLAPLGPLAHGLAAEWDDGLARLFRALAPDSNATAPLELLAAAAPARLAELAADADYIEAVRAAVARETERLGADSWYSTLPADRPRAIAYLSPEFGVSDALPQYSGGLGVLAGDHLKAASDLGVPIVAVGLFYRNGYFRQHLTASGEQRETFDALDPAALPMRRAVGPDGADVTISVQLPGAVLHAAVWQVDVGRVPLYLLDTDVPENAPAERAVTNRLYGGDREHRLRQEILLGIGGLKALAAVGADPEVFHSNEGHAGFLGIERIRLLVEEQGLDPATAIETVRAATVFTTHTPVPAGIDRFSHDLVTRYFRPGGVPSGLPIELLLELGAEPGGDPAVFNMAALGIRLAARVNGVSRLHGQVARGMFAVHFPGFGVDEVPIGHITNGVHAETWTGPEFAALYQARIGEGFGQQMHGYGAMGEVSDGELGAARDAARARLIAEVRRRLRGTWTERGIRDGQLAFIDGVLDPHALTIGFARRVPTYKRLTLMLRDPERLERLLLDPERPVQIVVAGKAHPDDAEGKAMIAALGAFAARPDLRHRIVILADYDMAIARVLVAGVDVWLNNPLRPFEACGTSGMKAALNGALNVSILDGWWDERYDGSNGWAIPSADDGSVDPVRRDDFEADALYDLLEREIVERFYGDRPAWLGMVRHTVSALAPDLLASRMLRDYVGDLYAPAAAEARRLTADGHAAARRLAAYRERVSAAWAGVEVVRSEVGEVGAAGSSVPVRARVKLGGLEPGEVSVEAVVDAAAPFGVTLEPGAEEAGERWFEGSLSAAQGSATLRIRVLPHHDDLEDPRTLGLVAQDDD
ncbi:MAG: glycogen phosphorylase [Gaiellaceae bacterium]|nr:glycogen phosphorylase [Gaiellaceae bacterium]